MDLRNNTLASRFCSPHDGIDDCSKAFIVNSVTILNRFQVTQVHTSKRGMLINHTVYLVLGFAAIDVVVFQS
jgi:hypothetical protein